MVENDRTSFKKLAEEKEILVKIVDPAMKQIFYCFYRCLNVSIDVL